MGSPSTIRSLKFGEVCLKEVHALSSDSDEDTGSAAGLLVVKRHWEKSRLYGRFEFVAELMFDTRIESRISGIPSNRLA